MARRDCGALDEKTLVLVFIAGNIREAERAESALSGVGIDYCLGAEHFQQGILSSVRSGVGFYVVEGQAAVARDELMRAALRSGVVSGHP